MAFYAVCLLGGIVLGLKAGLRALLACTALLAAGTFLGSLYFGDAPWGSLVRAGASVILIQVGFFAALVVRAMTHGPEHDAATSHRVAEPTDSGGAYAAHRPDVDAADERDVSRKAPVGSDPGP